MAGVVTPQYKIILLGEAGVGKTSCFYRLKDNDFQEQGRLNPALSVGLECFEYSALIDGVEIKAAIYDTAGAERFRSLTTNYFMNADAAILMFDVEDRYSFHEIKGWYDTTLKHKIDRERFVWAVVGNKSDLCMEIEHETIVSKCQQLGTELKFFTSAKTGENVKEMFEAVIREVHRRNRRRKSTRAENRISGLMLMNSSTSQDSKRRRCCRLK